MRQGYSNRCMKLKFFYGQFPTSCLNCPEYALVFTFVRGDGTPATLSVTIILFVCIEFISQFMITMIIISTLFI